MNVRMIPATRHTRNLRVAAYVRVSSSMSTQDESYEAQATYFENKIKSTPGWDYAGIYGERESGTHDDNRDDFQRMIDDALNGKIDLILVKSVSRWSRNIVDGLKAIKLLSGNRIHIVFEQEGIDTRVPGHAFQLNLAQAVAQTESEALSDNLKCIYRYRAQYGLFYANKNAYFGYNTDDGRFTRDDNAIYVRRIFQEFVEGKRLSDIARDLEGVKNNQGRPITPAQIRSILKNEVYKGDLHICKPPSRNVITGKLDSEQYHKYVEKHHDAIVSDQIWEAAQKRFEENRQRYTKNRQRGLRTSDEEIHAKEDIETQDENGYETVYRDCLISHTDGLKEITVEGNGPRFSFPLSEHRPESIINLVNTLFSKGSLLSKATGGFFSVADDLLDQLPAAAVFQNSGEVILKIREEGGLQGLSFSENEVIFDGFPTMDDPDTIQAWRTLSKAINDTAINQRHVAARRINDDNEKYAFCSWVNRLGLNGPEYKKERNILYKNLSGHTSFRTPEAAERWKAKHVKKRHEYQNSLYETDPRHGGLPRPGQGV